MKRITFLLLPFSLTQGNLVLAQSKQPEPPLPPYFGPKKRVAVTAMEVKVQGVVTTAPTPSGSTTVVTLDIQQPTEFGTGLADMLVTALNSSNRFILLERQNFEEISKERALSQGADFNPATAAQAGRLLGAQVIIRGAVTELAVKKSGSNVGGVLGDVVSGGKSTAQAVVMIDLKLIDVNTGQILDSVKAEGKVSSSQTVLNLTRKDIKLGGSAFNNSPLGQAVRAAIDNAVRRICERMEKVPWEARIAEILDEDGKTTIYINAGADSGLKVGDILEVARPGTEIRDPETQLVIGKTLGKVVGRLKVREIQKKLTLTDPVMPAEFKKEDRVTYVTP
jgi:curli biogenesis system outer membrane secretion channel CsgG